MNRIWKLLAAAVCLTVISCGKPDGDDGHDWTSHVDTTVPALQKKYELEASKDFNGMVNELTAGLKVNLYDTKHYADNERILSVSFTAESGDIVGSYSDGTLTGGGSTVTMEWASDDPVNVPRVGRKETPGEFGILCLPGNFKGKFTVRTDRYTYTFSTILALEAGKAKEVDLDFSKPDVQPTRKVGVMGDSISTFDGAMCNPDYSPFYPGSDPNVSSTDATAKAKAVDSKEKTYWWRLIYNYMEHGELDVNSSWSGTRVVHEVKTGRSTKKSIGAGFVDRAYDFVDPDIIVIHGGTNDHNQSTPVGTYDFSHPIGQLDEALYRSAYIKLIKMLQNRYEGVQLIIIIGDRLSSPYESSTLEIAKHFGIPYVDFVGVTVEKCSGSHPTAPAFDMMAKTIHDKLIDYLP